MISYIPIIKLCFRSKLLLREMFSQFQRCLTEVQTMSYLISMKRAFKQKRRKKWKEYIYTHIKGLSDGNHCLFISQHTILKKAKRNTRFSFILGEPLKMRVHMDFRWQWCVNESSPVIINVPLWWEIDNGGGYAWMGAGILWEISTSTQFCWKPKAALKNKLFKVFKSCCISKAQLWSCVS